MPWVSLYFFNIGVTGPFLAFGIIGSVSFFSSISVKKDTTNIALDTYNDEDSEELGIIPH